MLMGACIYTNIASTSMLSDLCLMLNLLFSCEQSLNLLSHQKENASCKILLFDVSSHRQAFL